MKMREIKIWPALLATLLGFASVLLAQHPPADPIEFLNMRAAETRAATSPLIFLSPSTRRSPSLALEDAIHKGLLYLASGQHENGSFDRLESARGVASSDAVTDGLEKDAAESDTEEIADTSLTAETMMFAVNSGRDTDLAPNCLKAIDFLCKQIKKWEGDAVYIQKRTFDPLHDTYPMGKDTRFYDSTVDTFFTFRFLCEAKERVDDAPRKSRIQVAIDILLSKIIRCQDVRGTWADSANPQDPLPYHPTKGAFPPAPPYDYHTKNLVTHCVALSAISIAVRCGVPVPVDVRYRAENYLQNALAMEKFQEQTKEQCIRIVTVAAAETQVDETCRMLLQNTLSDQSQSKDVTVEQLNVLRTHAVEARKNLQAVIPHMMELAKIPTEGPAMDALPEAIKGLRLVSRENAHAFLDRVSQTLMQQQHIEGNVPAVLDLTARDDSTFGTATSVRLMMDASDAAETAPAATQQQSPAKAGYEISISAFAWHCPSPPVR
jgi:hypothetical protein